MTRRKGAFLVISIFAFIVLQLIANYFRSNYNSVKDCTIDCDKQYISEMLLYTNLAQGLAILAAILFVVFLVKRIRSGNTKDHNK
ncbi:MAG: hypothetical protein C0490_15960 [Marivirga sp.]|jgi:hypothetical protein|nr:hypothetical protein [Marivirga sp.]